MGKESDRVSGKSLVFLFRYGAGEHVDFLPALPSLCGKLKEKGWASEHIGFRSHLAPPPELTSNCKVTALPFQVCRSSRVDKTLKATLWLLCLPWIGWRLQRKGVHTVFVDETLPLSAFALRLGYRGRLCFTIHDFFTDIYLTDRWWTKPVGRWLKKRDAKDWARLDLLFVRVTAAKDYLVSLGIPPERIHVIPDSVDTDLFSPGTLGSFRKQWGIEADDVVLIHHGILHPNKGNVRLVEALARMKTDVPELKTVLIGDGSEMPYLRQRIKGLGLQEHVILTGWLPGLREIADALRTADIGLVMRLGLPGDDFHVTSTLVHNLASGLPVLAVRLKGIQESITEGREGLLFDAECKEGFVTAITTLAKDREARERMGREARAAAEARFSRERIAFMYAEVLVE
jgi:glycosyltransferase involved in cell wall biosynthesis